MNYPAMAESGKSRSFYKIFDSRREFPRLVMNLPATITGVEGIPVAAIIHDLSPDGAQIRYRPADQKNLFSKKELESRETDQRDLLLNFRLQGEKQSDISVVAVPVYVHTLSKSTVAAGVFFDEKEKGARQLIKDFLYLQLEMTFMDMDDIQDTGKKFGPVVEIKQEEVINIKQVDDEPQKKVSKPGMEGLKQEMIRIQSSLKAIQETIRHVDEKISRLEQKIARKG